MSLFTEKSWGFWITVILLNFPLWLSDSEVETWKFEFLKLGNVFFLEKDWIFTRGWPVFGNSKIYESRIKFHGQIDIWNKFSKLDPKSVAEHEISFYRVSHEVIYFPLYIAWSLYCFYFYFGSWMLVIPCLLQLDEGSKCFLFKGTNYLLFDDVFLRRFLSFLLMQGEVLEKNSCLS